MSETTVYFYLACLGPLRMWYGSPPWPFQSILHRGARVIFLKYSMSLLYYKSYQGFSFPAEWNPSSSSWLIQSPMWSSPCLLLGMYLLPLSPLLTHLQPQWPPFCLLDTHSLFFPLKCQLRGLVFLHCYNPQSSTAPGPLKTFSKYPWDQ